jgi:hypothetical protein
MSATIEIRVDSVWLFNNLNSDDCQVLVFDKYDLSIVTVFDDCGMVKKTWTTDVGPSQQSSGTHAWTMSTKFFIFICNYYDDYPCMNLTLNVDDDSITVTCLNDYDVFKWEETDIGIDSTSTWELTNPSAIASVNVSVKTLQNIPEDLDTVDFELSENLDTCRGFKDGKQCWLQENVRWSRVFGKGKTSVQRSILIEVLEAMMVNKTHFVQIGILESGLLSIQHICRISGERVDGFVAPILI